MTTQLTANVVIPAGTFPRHIQLHSIQLGEFPVIEKDGKKYAQADPETVYDLLQGQSDGIRIADGIWNKLPPNLRVKRLKFPVT